MPAWTVAAVIVMWSVIAPWPWVSRSLATAFAALVALIAFFPDTSHLQLGLIGTLAFTLVFVLGVHGWIVLTALGSMVARAAIETLRRKGDVTPRIKPAWEITGMRWFSAVTAALFGLGAAGYAATGLGHTLAGAANGYAWHVGVALAAIGAGIAVWRLPLSGVPARWIRSGAVGLCGGLAVVSLLGLAHPGHLLAKAAERATGGSYCLSSPSRARPIEARQELTLFTADRGRVRESVLLTYVDGDEIKRARWSHRARKFVQDYPVVPPEVFAAHPCDPTPRFADGLSVF